MVTNRCKSSPVNIAWNPHEVWPTIPPIHHYSLSSENENIRHFSLSYNYVTYADRFVCLCEVKYLMFVCTSFRTSLIQKVKWI